MSVPSHRHLGLAVVLAVLALAAGADAHAAPRFFAPTSVWNAPDAAGLPLDPGSAPMVQRLVAEVRQEVAEGRGPGLGTRSRAPVLRVGPRAPRVPVQLDTGPWAADLQRVLDRGVPIPAGAVPGHGDGSLVVWQPATDTLWEFFQLQQALHPPRPTAAAAPGGALAAGTWTYRLTAVNARGETTTTRAGATATTAAGGRVVLRWPAIAGATGYRVYRQDGLLAAVGGDVTSFVDEGGLAPAPVAPPTANGAATPGQWRAAFGGRMRDVSRNPGHFTDVAGSPAGDLQQDFWGATATGLPLVAGMVTRADLRRGRIDHALALGLPNLTPETSLVAADRVVAPAQRGDGKSSHPAAIPEGTRLRLDPALDLRGLPMAPFTRMLARAAQRHGVIVQDGSAAVVFYGEDPLPSMRAGRGNPWERLLGPRRPGFLADFPWEHLQVTAAGSRL